MVRRVAVPSFAREMFSSNQLSGWPGGVQFTPQSQSEGVPQAPQQLTRRLRKRRKYREQMQQQKQSKPVRLGKEC